MLVYQRKRERERERERESERPLGSNNQRGLEYAASATATVTRVMYPIFL